MACAPELLRLTLGRLGSPLPRREYEHGRVRAFREDGLRGVARWALLGTVEGAGVRQGRGGIMDGADGSEGGGEVRIAAVEIDNFVDC